MFFHLHRTAGLTRRVLVGAWMATSLAIPASAQPLVVDGHEGAMPNLTRIADGELSAGLIRAVRGAARHLATDRCQQVLDDFSDANGQPLRVVVASLAVDPPAALSRVIFRDGREHAVCRSGGISAFTGAGSRVVFVCARQFLNLGRAEAERVVLHELLHTLGLDERPPSPADIDRAVARRCRR
jgi:hypothetical protein